MGELLGLKWEGVDFEALEVNVTLSVVKQKITRCKTEASREPVPLDAGLAEVLLNWKLQCPYPQLGDWVFASPHRKGKQPYWPSALVSGPSQASTRNSGDSGHRGLAYAPTHVRHLDESEWRRHQDHTGVVTPFELQSDGRYLHPGRHSDEACSADQVGENDSLAEQKSGGRARIRRVTFSYRTLSNLGEKARFQ